MPKLDPQFVETMLACEHDIGKYMRLFHEDRFSRPFSRAHHKLFELYNDESVKKVLVVAHRGFGKTSIFNYGIPSQRIVYEKSRFLVPVSASASHAVMQSENLKRELATNPMIAEAVGTDIKGDVWSKDEWTTSTGIKVMPRGQGQQVRGMIHHDSRPDFIIVDDLEKSEEVLSPEQRDKLKRWFFSDLYNAVDRALNKWRLFVVGTILHQDALLEDLRNDPTWEHVDFPLCEFDEEKATYVSFWPEFMSDEQVKALASEYRARALIDVFYLEYMNTANPREDAVFRPEHFRYYDESQTDLFGDPDVENVIIIDPSKTRKPHSAFTAIVGVAFRSKDNSLYVRDIVNARITTDEMYAQAFDMADRLGARVIGIEVTSLNEFVTKPFLDAMYKRGKIYEIVELKARKGTGDFASKNKGKEGRILALSPYYRMGHVFHNPYCCAVLEEQLLSYPNAKYWDVMDALAYVVEMTEIGGRYFTEDLADKVLSDEYNRDEREYDRLMAEDEAAFEECDFAAEEVLI